MTAVASRAFVPVREPSVAPIKVPAARTAWRLFGWFGLMLTVVGLTDLALQWYPAAFKSPEWELATVSVTIASLPLLTIGLTILLASFLAREVRIGVGMVGGVFAVLGICVVLALALFLSDVPLALRATSGPPALELKKSIVRTLVMGVAFGAEFWIAAVLSVRYLLRSVSDV